MQRGISCNQLMLLLMIWPILDIGPAAAGRQRRIISFYKNLA